jgi:hypothetical protein
MAASLNKMLRGLIIAMVSMSGVATIAVAEEMLNDPTRPAVNLNQGMTADGTAADTSGAAPPPGLQSVIISPKREAAIINGIEVEVGKKYGDAILTMVNETCVVLTGPQGRQVMYLFPTVSMTSNELACDKRPNIKPVQNVTNGQAHNKNSGNKARADGHAAIGGAEEIKDGSGK